MADEIRETEVVEVTQTVAAVEEAAPEESVTDWEAAPAYEETIVETTTVVDTTDAGTTTYFAPRGRWDFTDAQRIIIGVLLWLNILVAVTAYLAITGQLFV